MHIWRMLRTPPCSTPGAAHPRLPAGVAAFTLVHVSASYSRRIQSTDTSTAQNLKDSTRGSGGCTASQKQVSAPCAPSACRAQRAAAGAAPLEPRAAHATFPSWHALVRSAHPGRAPCVGTFASLLACCWPLLPAQPSAQYVHLVRAQICLSGCNWASHKPVCCAFVASSLAHSRKQHFSMFNLSNHVGASCWHLPPAHSFAAWALGLVRDMT